MSNAIGPAGGPAFMPLPDAPPGATLPEAIDTTAASTPARGTAPVRPGPRTSPPAAPHDPRSEAENQLANAAVASFTGWARYPYQVIVVPGYTPVDQKTPQPGVNATGMDRLRQAKKDFDSGKAPFILLSGGAVHPPGTPYFEALEMKKALLAMGVPPERVIVDCMARHSTTNLRNAGRYMLEHGMKTALVTTSRDQDFYFSHPTISTFNLRCREDLGYTLGDLHDGEDGFLGLGGRHSIFSPSPDVMRLNPNDPLDP
jgi:hypothetical protein